MRPRVAQCLLVCLADAASMPILSPQPLAARAVPLLPERLDCVVVPFSISAPFPTSGAKLDNHRCSGAVKPSTRVGGQSSLIL